MAPRRLIAGNPSPAIGHLMLLPAAVLHEAAGIWLSLHVARLEA